MESGSFSQTPGLADISYFYVLVPLLAFCLFYFPVELFLPSHPYFFIIFFFDNAVLILSLLWWLPRCLEKANDYFYLSFSMPGSNTVVNVEMKTDKSHSGIYENLMGKCFIANCLQIARL